MDSTFNRRKCNKGVREQALHLSREDAGKMFFVQSYNDLVFRSDPTLGIVSGGGGTLRTHSYDWTEQPFVHCFKPNVDVAVPAYASYRFSDIVHPHAMKRNYTVLARFGYRAGDGKNTVCSTLQKVKQTQAVCILTVCLEKV